MNALFFYQSFQASIHSPLIHVYFHSVSLKILTLYAHYALKVILNPPLIS